MVSHSMADLKKICDVGIVLHEGKLEYYDKIEDAVDRYKQINLMYDVKTEKDFFDLLFYKRNMFVELVDEAFVVEKDECFDIYFVIKFINKYLLFELNDKVICEKINATIQEFCMDLEKNENKIIHHFCGFLKRFDTKVVFNREKANRGCVLKRNKEFFEKKLEQMKIKIINISEIKEKINKLERII